MAAYTFEGQNIEIEFRAFSAFLWLAAGFVVRIGDRTYWPKPSGFRFTTFTEFALDGNQGPITGVVRSLGPIWFLPRVKCSIVVSGTEIARGFMPLRHWQLCYLASLIVFAVIALAIFGALVIAVMIFGGSRPT